MVNIIADKGPRYVSFEMIEHFESDGFVGEITIELEGPSDAKCSDMYSIAKQIVNEGVPDT